MGSENIPEDELAHFILQVRMLSSKEYPTPAERERGMKKIRQLANKLFRDYMGYYPDGRYRIKAKGERCFAEAVAAMGGAEGVMVRHLGDNPLLRQIFRGAGEGGTRTPGPSGGMPGEAVASPEPVAAGIEGGPDPQAAPAPGNPAGTGSGDQDPAPLPRIFGHYPPALGPRPPEIVDLERLATEDPELTLEIEKLGPEE